MKIARCLSILALATAMLSGCGGGKGSSAPAPANLTVTPEDGQITLNWDVVSGVQYRVYCAPGASVDNYSWYTTLGGASRADYLNKVLPPFTVDTLQNGLQYACTVDGRYDNGPAGPAAASRTATPQSAGTTWASASPTGLGPGALRGVAAGTLTGFSVDKFLAVSDSALLVTDDYLQGTWTTVSTLPSGLGNLNTVLVNNGRVYVAGSSGLVAYSSDLQNWAVTPASIGGPVRKLVGFGSWLLALGDAGLIRSSAYNDGYNWATPTSVPSNAPTLRDAAYSEAGYWVAVGDSGAVWVSSASDPAASTWTQATASSASANLTSVAALKVQTPNTSTFDYQLVAVGDGGMLGYSTAADPQKWTWQTIGGGVALKQVVSGGQALAKIDSTNSKIYIYSGGQFMVSGAGGTVWRSGDALSWTLQNASPAWEDVSAHVGMTQDPVALLRYSKLANYAGGIVRTAYAWLLYGSDGTGRYAR